MVRPHVSIQCPFAGRAVRTLVTRIGLLPSVSAHVRLQIRSLVGTVGAMRTGERLLSGVCAHVVEEIGGYGGPVQAERALVDLAWCHGDGGVSWCNDVAHHSPASFTTSSSCLISLSTSGGATVQPHYLLGTPVLA